MHAQLIQKNRVVNGALDTIQKLYNGVQRDLSEARRLQQSLVRETNGVASALMTARLAGYLSGYSPSQNIALIDRGDGAFDLRDPAETASQLNEILLQEMNTDLYFTLALACIDLETGQTRCVQAGHPHPLHICHDGHVIKRGAGGMPIGLLPDAQYQTFDFALKPGDRLFLHSDGLTEAEDAAGTQLDDSGLEQILRTHKCLTGDTFLDIVYTELTAFNGGRVFEDDVSALVFEYNGVSRPVEAITMGDPIV